MEQNKKEVNISLPNTQMKFNFESNDNLLKNTKKYKIIIKTIITETTKKAIILIGEIDHQTKKELKRILKT